MAMKLSDTLSVQLYDDDTLNVNLSSDLSRIVVNNYEELSNLPQINSITLIGDILSSALGIKLSDLIQDENTFTVLNCGTSTEVV